VFAEGSDDEEVFRMKWVAIGLGASLLALAVGALALTTRGGGQSTRIATTTVASNPIDALIPVPTTPLSAPVSPAKKRARSGSSLPKTCQSNGGDESDETGDDRPEARSCRSDSSGDNQAGDNQRDQVGDDQAGDSESGDNAGDNQAGDNAGGNQP
jgi:hypothetical protein